MRLLTLVLNYYSEEKFQNLRFIINLRMATLLPWNFFITPFAYWMTKLQRPDWKNHTQPAEPTEAPINFEVSLINYCSFIWYSK